METQPGMRIGIEASISRLDNRYFSLGYQDVIFLRCIRYDEAARSGLKAGSASNTAFSCSAAST